jgi:serine/threonine-protein kinase
VLALSPDGRTLALCVRHQGQSQLHLRRLGDPRLVPLEGTENARDPFFSPDGEWIGYFAGTQLFKVSVRGGKPTALGPGASDRGGAWLEDGTIVLSRGFTVPLTRVPEDGGEPQPLTILDSTRSERTHRWPERLPGSDWVLFTCGTAASPGDYEDATIEAVSRRTGERRVLARGAMARYSPTGHLVFARGGVLHAARLDARDPKPVRSPLPVLSGIGGETTSGAYHFDVADDGTLAYLPSGIESQDRELVWLGLDGTAQPNGAPSRRYQQLSLSPDRRRILASVGAGGGARGEAMLVDVATGATTRLPLEVSVGTHVWLDDRRFVFSGDDERGPVIGVHALGSSDTPRIVHRSDQPLMVTDRIDGREVLFSVYGQPEADIVRLAVEGDTVRIAVAAGGRGNQSFGRISPDGRWISFQSNDTGRSEIYVAAFGRPGERVQITANGGQWSTWSPDGHALYFVEGGAMMMAPVQTRGRAFGIGRARVLFDLPYTGSAETPLSSFDMDASGTRFLTARLRGAAAEQREVTIARGWASGLEREMRGAR